MHLDILRKLATSPNVLRSANHTLPVIEEVHAGPYVLCVFPFAGGILGEEAWDLWPRNSVGDVLNMFLQALEVSVCINSHVFLHSH